MTRVLIVEDKEENLYYLNALLTGHGCVVETAHHGAEALVKARKAPPNVIISDLLMPVMDGYTLLRQWKADARLSPIPFIVYTATYTEEQDEKLAMDLGADAFILKPCDPKTFIARLREVEAQAMASAPNGSKNPVEDEETLLKSYSETLIRKLEEKTLQLEEANRRLERDVHERKKAEAAQRQMAETRMAILNALPAHIALVDNEGVILSVNEAWRRFGNANMLRSLDFCVGENYLHVCAQARGECSEEAAQIEAGIRRVLQGELKEFSVEYPCHSPTEQRWFRLMVTPLDAVERIGAVVMHVNITERKVAESEIKRTLRRLTEAQRIGQIGDWEWNIATEAITWSPQVFEILGRDPASGPPRDFEENLRPFDQASQTILKEKVKQAIDSGEAQNYELVAQRSDGQRVHVQATAVPKTNETGQLVGLYGTVQDITERKKIEHQFLRAQRMESIGTLAGGIAHDFNNLLAPILMGIDFIKQFEPDDAILTILKAMQDSADRGRGLVKQVLSFAQGADGARGSVQLGEIVKEIESILGNTFPKNITIERDIEDGLWSITGDSTQINQVILNLCVNARDAMDSGGRLKILARNLEINDLIPSASGNIPAGRHVVLEVADEGCGMPPEVIQRMFEPFFTTKGTGKGTGLGLSTAARIVRDHGGCMDVSSEVGKGSVFKVYFPVQLEQADSKPADAKVENPPRGNGELILVVDDEASIRDISKQALEAFGYRVLAAADGARAVELYTPRQHEISLVLVDMIMPNMDGAALSAALRKINPDVRIIAVSGEPKADGGGSNHFLTKPFTAQQMLLLVKTVLSS